MMLLQKIDLANIVDPLAPVRAQIDPASLQELADSIRELGLIQPIVVRPAGEKFEVVAGHRRLMACRMLDLPAVECLVRENAGEADVTAERLHENLIRKDMTPVEEAVVYAELFEKYGDLERVAAMAHRSLAVVERRLALLAGDAAIRDALHAGEISSGVAEELNRVKDKTTRAFLLRFAVAEGATVNKVSAWRRQYVNVQLVPGQEPSAPEVPPAPDAEPNPMNVCWLCGSQQDPHELRVRMVHQYCERMWRRTEPPEGSSAS